MVGYSCGFLFFYQICQNHNVGFDFSDRVGLLTEHKEKEYSELLAEATLEATDNGILLIDRERRLSKCNARFVSMWEIPSGMIESADDNQLIDCLLDQLTDPQQFLATFNTLCRDPHAESLDLLDLTDGRVIERYSNPLFLHGEPVARLWSFRDVTDSEQIRRDLQKQVEELESSDLKLKRSEEQLSLAMRGTNDGLWDWDLETDEVYYSPRWKNMLGYAEHELENHLNTWASLVHPEEKDRVLQAVRDYLDQITPSFEVEMRMLHKAGHHVFVLSRAFLTHRAVDNKPVRLVGTHVDITERKKAEDYLQKNAEILQMIASGVAATLIYDQIALMYEGRHPGMRCSMLELEDGRLLHGGAPSLPKAYCDAVHGLKNGPDVGSCGTSTYTGRRVLVEDIETDPKWRELKHVALPHGMRCCWSEPIKNSSGHVLGAFGMYYDHAALPTDDELEDLKSAARLAGIVMERDQDHKRIRDLAYKDQLTGLSSRTDFYHHLREAVKLSKRHDSSFFLLYIDLDDFKGVNDSLGHDAGDLLLQAIARRLKNVSREIDLVARLSGDEFCILVNDVDDDLTAAQVAQRVLTEVSEPIQLSSRKFTPSCSIGIACYPDDGEDLSTLLKAADTSLYSAKEQGKNQYAFYKPELTKKAEMRFQLEQALREAVEQQHLTLVYQPQIELSSNRIVGVEALSRWHHPQLGQVPPAEFIATAERIGMIKPLTQWVLNRACTQVVDWIRSGLPPVRVAVNISPSYFLDKEFASMIEQTIARTGMQPGNLVLEVTEGVVQTDQENLRIFEQLKQLGVIIAIDDFGTGYSSFASLKHLAAESLKIDKHFINDMFSDDKTRMLIASMIEIGHNLDHTITAEGIETQAQFDALREMGCEMAQGFFISRPVPASEIAGLLTEQADGNGVSPLVRSSS